MLNHNYIIMGSLLTDVWLTFDVKIIMLAYLKLFLKVCFIIIHPDDDEFIQTFIQTYYLHIILYSNAS